MCPNPCVLIVTYLQEVASRFLHDGPSGVRPFGDNRDAAVHLITSLRLLLPDVMRIAASVPSGMPGPVARLTLGEKIYAAPLTDRRRPACETSLRASAFLECIVMRWRTASTQTQRNATRSLGHASSAASSKPSAHELSLRGRDRSAASGLRRPAAGTADRTLGPVAIDDLVA